MIVVWIVLGAVFLLLAQERLYRRFWDKNLTVGLSFSEKSAMEGDMCALFETVENRKIMPLPALKVKFAVSRQLAFAETDSGSSVTDQFYRNDVLSIRPYMRHVRRLPFLCKKRGYYTINALDVVAGNLFLSAELPKELTSDAQLYVYPKPWQEQSFLQALQRITGEVLTKRHLMEDPFEYRGIREYSPRDSMRDINWKATARTDELKVVRLFLNLEDGAILRQMEILEASISMAAGACAQFLSQGIRTALYTNGPDILTGELVGLDASSGIGHMESINRGLARIDLEKGAPKFVRNLEDRVLEEDGNAGAVFTIFISSDAQEDFQELLCKCAEKKADFVWIYPVPRQDEGKIRPALEPFTEKIRMYQG